MNMFSRLIEAEENRDFTENFNEYPHAFLAQRCSNKRGRYMAVAEYKEGRKRDAVILPEGKSSGLAFAG